MCLQLNELDLYNLDVLADQLIGVDSYYFSKVIEALRKKMSEDIHFKIEYTYLFGNY
jgi:hypothetical protein